MRPNLTKATAAAAKPEARRYELRDVTGLRLIVHPNRPAVRFDVMGLLFLLQGGEVIALIAEGASIRRPSGAVLRFPRPAAGGVLLSEAAHA